MKRHGHTHSFPNSKRRWKQGDWCWGDAASTTATSTAATTRTFPTNANVKNENTVRDGSNSRASPSVYPTVSSVVSSIPAIVSSSATNSASRLKREQEPEPTRQDAALPVPAIAATSPDSRLPKLEQPPGDDDHDHQHRNNNYNNNANGNGIAPNAGRTIVTPPVVVSSTSDTIIASNSATASSTHRPLLPNPKKKAKIKSQQDDEQNSIGVTPRDASQDIPVLPTIAASSASPKAEPSGDDRQGNTNIHGNAPGAGRAVATPPVVVSSSVPDSIVSSSSSSGRPLGSGVVSSCRATRQWKNGDWCWLKPKGPAVEAGESALSQTGPVSFRPASSERARRLPRSQATPRTSDAMQTSAVNDHDEDCNYEIATDYSSDTSEVELPEKKGEYQKRCDDKWEDMFQLLLEYKKEYGDTLVSRYSKKHSKLGNWVRWQRLAMRKNKVPKNRIARLQSIRFVFDGRQKSIENQET